MEPQECITLPSGLSFDYHNMFGEDKVNAGDIESLSVRIEAAIGAVEQIRDTGVAQGHLSKDGEPELVLFPQLPYKKEGNINSPGSIARLKHFGDYVRNNVDTVISFGIGGSYLGNKVIFDTHCGEFWNMLDTERRQGYPKFFFSGNNIDPLRTAQMVSLVQKEAHESLERGCKYKVLLIVISKSGSTVDTMSTFLTAFHALQKDETMQVEVVAVTDPAEGDKETMLRKLAREKGWQTFSVPDGIGGRFSVFSEVGLLTAVCVGYDIEAFLSGARSMDEQCSNRYLWQNPALLSAVLKYIAAEKYGCDIEVFMPYGDYLKSVAEWYVQLLAESLGKRRNKDGEIVFYGRTPIVAVGTTDMHAQTQQHQDGKKDKVVQFLRVGKWKYDPAIPDCFPETPGLSVIAGIPMSKALDSALDANAEALASDNRFNACITIPKLDAFHLGELLYMLMLSVAYEGELANVDAFDQPGVETYKRIMTHNLSLLRPCPE